MPAIEFDAIIYDRAENIWLAFKDPISNYSLSDPSKILATISDIEKQCRERELFAVGYLAYEAGHVFNKTVSSKLPKTNHLMSFNLYNGYAKLTELPIPDSSFSLSDWKPSIDHSQYQQSIFSIKEWIRSGYTYQVNFTFRLKNSLSGDPYSLFYSMVNSQIPGYSAFLKFKDISICSASPELFFIKTNTSLICKPMKGTIRRGRTLAEDLDLKSKLKNSLKDQAENIMIVDMTRNDLGKISKTGSVRTKDLFEVEKYPTLWQMTSTVESETSETISSIFQALFPCSSITGAPKISTMRIIEELESTPRGIYTGAIGVIKPNLDCQFSVAIRTAIVNNKINSLTYGVGGGIVWDSTDQGEYEEALLKAEVITNPHPQFELKESILWSSEGGYFLFEKHLDRLAKSAKLFDFSYDQKFIISELNQLCTSLDQTKHFKVNLYLTKKGRLSFKWVEISENQPVETKIKYFSTPVNSKDWRLYHKTTLQDPHLKTIPNPLMEDDLFYNEVGQITETSIANIAVEMDGKLYTPPVLCGLLPGVYREHLLETGILQEKIIHREDINSRSKIFLFNSIRKFWGAVLVE